MYVYVLFEACLSEHVSLQSATLPCLPEMTLKEMGIILEAL